jgi:integrase/recombinase XerC
VLAATAIGAKLREIDRTTLAGQRDYALLSLAVFTARRVAELADLRRRDLEVNGQVITVHFRHTKGGKQQIDTLSPQVAGALRRYLVTTYGPEWLSQPADAPIWISCSRNKSAGRPISAQAIADICAKHLGVSTVHTTRHSWAKQMDDMGAPVTIIQRRLGHSNVATTQRYLRNLPQAVNPYGDQLEAAFGITEA